MSELGTQPRDGCRINVLKHDLEYEANTSGHIFISYSKQNPGPTRKLATRLEQKGFKVWWDTDLASGDDYESVIRSKIETASAVIVIWSPASVKSLFVKSEAKRALLANKLICAMTDGIDENDVPMPFDQLHGVAADDFEEILWALEQHGVIRD